MIAAWLWHRKEAFIWLGALAFLAISDPICHHYTLCPLDNLGFDYCPGCGLGRSIGYLFRLEIRESFLAHPLGIPAAILLVYRIVKVFKTNKEFQLSTI
jgi:hypothetical protein